MSRGLDKLPTLRNCGIFCTRQYIYVYIYETTCILYESFSYILEIYLVIVKPNLRCDLPYFHGLWYFYLKRPTMRFSTPNGQTGLKKRATQVIFCHVYFCMKCRPTNSKSSLTQIRRRSAMAWSSGFVSSLPPRGGF